jgi:hypothetical protein
MSNNAPSISHTPPTAHPDNQSDIEKLRRYSSTGLPSASRDSFASARSDVTIGPPTAARSRSRSPDDRGRGASRSRSGTGLISERSRSRSASRDFFNADSVGAGESDMMVRSKFKESEFGGAYEGVETGYGGDKRQQF